MRHQRQISPDLKAIRGHFDSAPQRVFSVRSLSNLLHENAPRWHTESLPWSQSLEMLEKAGFTRIELRPSSGSTLTRFAWRDASDFGIALSISDKMYLCHLSAMVLHDLTDQVPTVIYVNREQTPKPPGGDLTQDSIDGAFSRKARASSLVYRFDDRRVTVLSGKASNRLEVGQKITSSNERLSVTNIERTLIDITVRPNYAGGVAQVLEAFRRARESVSTNTLVATLRQLDYVYPYHQAIGFYMERSGYSERSLSMMRQFRTDFDFYLTHAMVKTDYNSSWRIYYPKGF